MKQVFSYYNTFCHELVDKQAAGLYQIIFDNMSETMSNVDITHGV